MRTIKIIIACIISVLFLSFAGVAGALAFDVYPTGGDVLNRLHPIHGVFCTEDLYNVQLAIFIAGEGGTVILHSTNIDGIETAFNFGAISPSSANCFIPYSITIQGEDGGDTMTGKGMTVIEGGIRTFLIFEIFGLATYPASVEIRNVHFKNHKIAAIAAFKCQNFTTINNRITADTMGWRASAGEVPPGKTQFEANGFRAYGITIMGYDIFTQAFDPAYIYGQVVIQDNYFNLEQDGVPLDWAENPDWWETWGTRSICIMATNAGIVIEKNHCINDTWEGIALWDNYGVMTVEKNVLELGPRSTVPMTPDSNRFATCIVAQQFTPVSYADTEGNANIIKNTLVCNENQVAIGLGSWYVASGTPKLGQSSVERNEIRLSHSMAGIFLVGLDEAYIDRNEIKGKSEYGMILGGSTEEACSVFGDTDNNILERNDSSKLKTSEVDVFFNMCTSHNIFVGEHETYIDNGVDNEIVLDY